MHCSMCFQVNINYYLLLMFLFVNHDQSSLPPPPAPLFSPEVAFYTLHHKLLSNGLVTHWH